MKIIIDGRMPDEAKQKLQEYTEVMELSSQGITYEAISGHPDIFLCQSPEGLIVAPNCPDPIKKGIKRAGIPFIPGKDIVGGTYPGTSGYNAVINEKYLIHNTAYTDASILKMAEGRRLIHVAQGYTRCNLLALDEDHYLTSDRGIEKSLRKHNVDVVFVSPESILLPGFNHGFLGGCCGIFQQQLFICGTLSSLKEENDVREYIAKRGMQIIELYDGPLFDAGGIFFFD